MNNRVVITGIGIYSTIGKNINSVQDSLYKGISGIGFDPIRKQIGYRSGLTGVLERPDLKPLLHRKFRNNLAEPGEYAYMSSLEAIKNAKLDEDYFNNNIVGIIFGNDSSAEPVITATDLVREKKDTTLIGSNSIFQSMNSTVTMNLSVIFKLRGINFTVSSACSSGSHALGLAYMLIKHGYQTCLLCGGAQEINMYSVASFDGLSAFSIQEQEPAKACKPFDKNRDGLVPSGGAASLIVESLENAQKRNANILAEIIGYGFSSNGEHISKSNVDGPSRSLVLALADANIKANEVDYINAHATGTFDGDMCESLAIDKVFNGLNTLVSSTKSMTGHEMWMAGASEVVYSTIMINNSFIAPNINFENPDEYSAKINITPKVIDKNLDIIVSNSFGFGGTNSTLILKKFSK